MRVAALTESGTEMVVGGHLSLTTQWRTITSRLEVLDWQRSSRASRYSGRTWVIDGVCSKLVRREQPASGVQWVVWRVPPIRRADRARGMKKEAYVNNRQVPGDHG
jgi:hypothetical protein